MIITLCGSTKFKEEYLLANKHLTLAGHIVLSVAMFGHHEQVEPTPEQKAVLDDVHLQKIDLSHAIFVIDPGGYVGESTQREIVYAGRTGKDRYWLSGILPGGARGSWGDLLKEWEIRAFQEDLKLSGCWDRHIERRLA